MASAKELQQLFGIPSRTIDTWSKTRDDRYLLSQFLKSFSTFDIQDRLDRIAQREKFVRIKKEDFERDIKTDPYKAGIAKDPDVRVSDPQIIDGTDAPDFILNLDDKSFAVVEIIPIVPSSKRMEERFIKLKQYADAYARANSLEKYTLLIITKSNKSFLRKHEKSLPFLTIEVYDLDEVAKNLYDGYFAVLI